MRNWPEADEKDLREWAKELVQELSKAEQDTANSAAIGQIAEFANPPATVGDPAIRSVPNGWLECDGSTFDEASFPKLAIKLGGTTLPSLSPVYDPSYVVGIRAA